MSTIVFVGGCAGIVLLIYWSMKSSKNDPSGQSGFFAFKSPEEDESDSGR